MPARLTARPLVLLATLSTPVLCAAPAKAEQGFRWNPFRAQQTAASSAAYDRDFVRRWERNPPRGFPSLSRANIEATAAAISRYQKIVQAGGWPEVADRELRPGQTARGVTLLRNRLLASGDLQSGSAYPAYFGLALERALKRFQATNGLSPTGIADRRTRAALNISAATRLRQLKLNLSRLRRHAKPSGGSYVAVNIPAAQIEVVSNDAVVSRHAGVVGKIDRQTPLISSSIHEINFNPVWRLPPTVVTEDLIPRGRRMQRNKQDVLEAFGIDAYSGNRKLNSRDINWLSREPYNLRYRQQPGPDNPLGFAKINFHNAHAVYLHDTPSDRIFGRNFRAASSGCVRVEHIEALIAWLLRDNDGWSLARVRQMRKSGKTETVRLTRRVPLHFVYLTAWATEDGVIQFRRDVYRRDGVGRLAASY